MNVIVEDDGVASDLVRALHSKDESAHKLVKSLEVERQRRRSDEAAAMAARLALQDRIQHEEENFRHQFRALESEQERRHENLQHECALKTEQISSVRARESKLLESNLSLTADMRKMLQRIDIESAEQLALRSRIDALHAELSEATEALKESDQVRGSLAQKVKDLQDELAQTTRELQELRALERTGREQSHVTYEKLNATCEALTKQLQERGRDADVLEERCKRLEESLRTNCEETNRISQAADESRGSAEAKINQAIAEKDALREELRARSNAESKLKEFIANLELQIGDRQCAEQKLRKQAFDLRTQADDWELEAKAKLRREQHLSEHVRSLEDIIDNSRTENALRFQAEKQRFVSEMSVLENRSEKNEQETRRTIDELGSQCAQHVQELRSQSVALKDSFKEREGLIKQLAEAKETLASSKQIRESLEVEVALMSDRLGGQDECQNEMSQMEENLSSSLEELTELRSRGREEEVLATGTNGKLESIQLDLRRCEESRLAEQMRFNELHGVLRLEGEKLDQLMKERQALTEFAEAAESRLQSSWAGSSRPKELNRAEDTIGATSTSAGSPERRHASFEDDPLTLKRLTLEFRHRMSADFLERMPSDFAQYEAVLSNTLTFARNRLGRMFHAMFFLYQKLRAVVPGELREVLSEFGCRSVEFPFYMLPYKAFRDGNCQGRRSEQGFPEFRSKPTEPVQASNQRHNSNIRPRLTEPVQGRVNSRADLSAWMAATVEELEAELPIDGAVGIPRFLAKLLRARAKAIEAAGASDCPVLSTTEANLHDRFDILLVDALTVYMSGWQSAPSQVKTCCCRETSFSDRRPCLRLGPRVRRAGGA